MDSPHGHKRTIVLALILLSVVARVTTLKGNYWRLAEDKDDYLTLARNLSFFGTFGFGDAPTAYRPPLYPLVLSPIYLLERFFGTPWGWRVTEIAILHVLFGASTTVLTYKAAIQWGLDRWSLLAAGLVALDPLLLHNARLPMTETLATFLMIASVVLLASDGRSGVSWRDCAAGAVLGLAMLCRTTFWAFALLAALGACVPPNDEQKRPWRRAGTVLAVALAVQLPWGIRNWLQLGWPRLTTTHGGYTLLLGNNDAFYDEVIHGQPGNIWDGESLSRWQRKIRELSPEPAPDDYELDYELYYDAFCYRTAWNTIRSRPADFLHSVVYRVVSLWRVTPHDMPSYSGLIRLGCTVFYVPELLFMVLGLVNRRVWRWPLILLPTALFSFTLVHAIYWSDMRMRAPIMPAVAILAAMGAQRVCIWKTADHADERG